MMSKKFTLLANIQGLMNKRIQEKVKEYQNAAKEALEKDDQAGKRLTCKRYHGGRRGSRRQRGGL